jgi:hypothetical protein
MTVLKFTDSVSSRAQRGIHEATSMDTSLGAG